MKAILTLLTIAIFTISNARDARAEPSPMKISVEAVDFESVEKPVELNTDGNSGIEEGEELARLYKSKNYLVKKELKLRTKAHKTKLA